MFYFCIFNYLVPIVLPALVRSSPHPCTQFSPPLERGGVGGGQYSAHLLPTSLLPTSFLLGYFPENLAVPKESCNFAHIDE